MGQRQRKLELSASGCATPVFSEAEKIPFENSIWSGGICHLLLVHSFTRPTSFQSWWSQLKRVGNTRGSSDLASPSCQDKISRGGPLPSHNPPLHQGLPTWNRLTPKAKLKSHLSGHVSHRTHTDIPFKILSPFKKPYQPIAQLRHPPHRGIHNLLNAEGFH